MKALIVSYYVICYSINLLNLSLLGLLYLRQRSELYLRELLFMLGLMIISLTLTLPSLFPWPETAGLAGDSAMLYLFAISNLAGISLVTATAPAYIHSFRPTRSGRMVSRLWMAGAALAFTAALSELFLVAQLRLIYLCFGLMVGSVAWSVGWFLAQMARHRQAMLAHDSGRVAFIMCLLTLVFMPVIIMVDFLNLPLPFLPRDAGLRLTFVPLFLATWSALLLWKNAGRLVTTPVLVANPQACLDDPTCSDLSLRERDVLKLLVLGMSYHDIADQLCISHSTVKTHIRRIYQKTGTSGKFALISRLKGANHPKG